MVFISSINKRFVLIFLHLDLGPSHSKSGSIDTFSFHYEPGKDVKIDNFLTPLKRKWNKQNTTHKSTFKQQCQKTLKNLVTRVFDHLVCILFLPLSIGNCGYVFGWTQISSYLDLLLFVSFSREEVPLVVWTHCNSIPPIREHT